MATIEKECAAVLCCLLEAVQANEVSSSFHNSCTGLQRFDSPRLSNGNKPLSSSSASKRSGGFTCCVPGCFTNSKRNPEFSFYNFPSGKSEKSKELRQKWIGLIARESFSSTKGHRMCSLHFPGRGKTYMNRLQYLNVPIPTNFPTSQPLASSSLTIQAQNIITPVPRTTEVQTGRRRLFSELDNDNQDVSENVDDIVDCLLERVAELLPANKKLVAA
jgi:hypothetical protein